MVTSVLGPYPRPVLPVTVEVGGVSATVTYAGAAPALIAGLMQVAVQVLAGVQPGGYVPVQLFVGPNATIAGGVDRGLEQMTVNSTSQSVQESGARLGIADHARDRI